MNYFDIRKLAAALSNIRVAFLKSKISLENIDIQSILKSMPSLTLTQEDIDAVAKMSATLQPSVSQELSAEEIAANALVENIFARLGTSLYGRARVLTKAEVDKAVLEATNTTMLHCDSKLALDIGAVEHAILDAIHSEPSASAMHGYVSLDDIVAGVYKAIHSETGEISTDITLSDIAMHAPEWIGLGDFDTVTALDLDCTGSVFREGHFAAKEMSEMLDIRNAMIRASETTGIAAKGVSIKTLGFDDLVARASDALHIKANIYSDLQVSTVAKLFESATMLSEMNLGFSMDNKPSLAVALAILCQAGATIGINVSPNNDEAIGVKVAAVNLRDMFNTLCASYGVTQKVGCEIESALKIVAMAEMDVKDIQPFDAKDFITGGTLCVAMTEIGTLAAVTLLKSVFNATIIATASESQRTFMNEEIDMNFSAKMMAYESRHVDADLEGGLKLTAALGYQATKYLRDYVDSTLAQMKQKTLDGLCVERA